MSDRRVSIFDQTLGSFRGAADLVMGMESHVRERRNQDLAAGALMQRMEFDRAMQPLRLGLLREQIAGQHNQSVLEIFRLGQLRHADEMERSADAAVHAGFNRLFQEFSAYRGGGVGQSLGVGSVLDVADPGDAADTAGSVAEPDAAAGGSGGSVYQPGLDGAFGESLPVKAPPVSDAAPESLLPALQADPVIPFAPDGSGPDGGVIEGSGDGPGGAGPLSIVEREIAAQRAKRDAAAGAGGPGTAAPAANGLGGVPQSVILKKKFELMLQAAGGQHGMGTRFQQWLPKVAEAVATLSFDPEAIAWERNQADMVKRREARMAAVGKIASAGLKADDFADVLRAIDAGFPVDPGVLDKRIEAGYKLREELAKKQAESGNVLSGMVSTPGIGGLASAGIGLFARASKEKAGGMQAALADMLTRGDLTGARGLLRAAAIDLAPTAIQNEYAAAGQMQAAVSDAKRALAEFYQKHPDGTGPIVGRQVSNVTGNREIQALRTRLALSRQAYIKAVTGAGMTDAERASYEAMFPDVTKTREQNTAQMDELAGGLGSRRAAAANAVLGDLAPLIEGTATPPSAPAAPIAYSSPESLQAAVARGEIKPGQTIIFQGQVIRYKGNP